MPSPTEVGAQRKRCRQDLVFDSTVPPPSGVVSSARDPQAPNVSVVVRAEVERQRTAGVGTTDMDGSDILSNKMPSQFRSGAVAPTSSGATALGRYESKSGAVLSAAKQAAAVLKQHVCRGQQQQALKDAQHAEQAHRYLGSEVSIRAPLRDASYAMQTATCELHVCFIVMLVVALVSTFPRMVTDSCVRQEAVGLMILDKGI